MQANVDDETRTVTSSVDVTLLRAACIGSTTAFITFQGEGITMARLRGEGVDTDLQPRVTPQSYHFEASAVGRAAPARMFVCARRATTTRW